VGCTLVYWRSTFLGFLGGSLERIGHYLTNIHILRILAFVLGDPVGTLELAGLGI